MPQVSIVLPTYNRAYCISECIEAIQKQTFTDWELIICDDSDNCDTTKVVAGIEDSRIHYHANTTRLGLPANRNKGISLTAAPLIWFVEDDVTVSVNCLEQLVKGFKAMGDKTGAVGPLTWERLKRGRLMGLERRVSGKTKCRDCPAMLGKYTGLIYQNFTYCSQNIVPSPVLPSWSLFSRKALEEVGGYESNAYNRWNYSHEESDLYFRLRKASYSLYFQPNATALHWPASSGGTRTTPLRYVWCYIGAHAVYLKRNYGLRAVYMIPAFIFYLAWEAVCGIPAIMRRG